jgi:hypothetical protein
MRSRAPARRIARLCPNGQRPCGIQRTAPTAANLVLEYEVSGIEAGIENVSDAALRQAVADACRQEIQQMRTALRALGDGLCEQLSEEGSDPDVNQTTNYDDSRTWTDRRTELAIDPSEYHSETRLDGYEGAADARLVRKTVEITIWTANSRSANYTTTFWPVWPASGPRGTSNRRKPPVRWNRQA